MLIRIGNLLKKYNLQPKAVLHVGANEGQEASEYLNAGINEGLFIEAIPDVYERLKRNLRHTPYQAINACITDKDYERVVFNIANNGGQSSSVLQFGQPHITAHPTVKMVNRVEMKSIRLDTLLDQTECVYDFINFDLQGAEGMALRSMGKYMKNVECAYLEINKRETYLGCALLPEITEIMEGFTMVEQSDWIGDTWADSFWISNKLL